jgi:cobalamin biosynthesis Mg chelatase CobN
MSFGTSTMPSDYYVQWYNNYLSSLVNAGAIPVAAAGNDDQDACVCYPAASPYAFGIGSYNKNYTVSSFSNYGSCVDIYAPGNNIISSWFTSDNSYAIASGTSMAAPVITAIVSDLLWSNNALTYNQVLSFLQQPSNNVNLMSCPSQTCEGIKVSCNAMEGIATTNPTTTTTTTTTTTAKPTTTTTTTAKPTDTTTKSTTTSRPTTSTAKPTTSTEKQTTTSKPTTLKPTTSKPITLKPTTTTTESISITIKI